MTLAPASTSSFLIITLAAPAAQLSVDTRHLSGVDPISFYTMAPSRGPAPTPRVLHKTLSNHKGPVHVARYAKGTAKYVLTGGQDRTVRLWNPDQGTEIKSYSAHGYEVLSLTVYVPLSTAQGESVPSDGALGCRAHDNSKFASSGGDRQVFLWDVMTGQTIRRIAGHMGKIFAVEFNEDATVVASGMVS